MILCCYEDCFYDPSLQKIAFLNKSAWSLSMYLTQHNNLMAGLFKEVTLIYLYNPSKF